MFEYLPDEIILIIISNASEIISLFLSCKLFSKYYVRFNERLLKCALLREIDLIPNKSKDILKPGERVFSDRNYKVISQDSAGEVSQYGRRICGIGYTIKRKKHRIIINGEDCKPGIITSGPTIESRDSYYLRYIYDSKNIGFNEPKLNMIVIIEHGGYLHEYVVTNVGSFNSVCCIDLIDGGKHKRISELRQRSPKQIYLFKYNNKWYSGCGEIIKFGGFL